MTCPQSDSDDSSCLKYTHELGISFKQVRDAKRQFKTSIDWIRKGLDQFCEQYAISPEIGSTGSFRFHYHVLLILKKGKQSTMTYWCSKIFNKYGIVKLYQLHKEHDESAVKDHNSELGCKCADCRYEYISKDSRSMEDLLDLDFMTLPLFPIDRLPPGYTTEGIVQERKERKLKAEQKLDKYIERASILELLSKINQKL